MRNKRLERWIFAGTSLLTKYFPRSGARILDAVITRIARNPFLIRKLTGKNNKVLKKIRECNRILIIPDSLIGDTIQMQSSITAVRDFFPNAQIDYIANQFAYPLVKNNPDASHIFPLFLGKSFPTQEDIKWIQALVQREQYQLCFNLSPFILDSDLGVPQQNVINFMRHAPKFIQNESNLLYINHYTYQCYEFIHEALSQIQKTVRPKKILGVSTFFTESVFEEALSVLKEIGFSSKKPVIFFNPDTASPYTMLPFECAVELISGLTTLDVEIVLGVGYSIPGLGIRLKEALPVHAQSRISLLKSIPLPVFAVLLDFMDVVISGDTATMHIAASRKVCLSNRYHMRNKTAVSSIFGATLSRLSGYDSMRSGYLPAYQDAPSWCYPVDSACRNISCLNKMFKTCEQVRCFEDFQVQKVLLPIAEYLKR